MNYKVGDTVVCVEGLAPILKKGQNYIVKGLHHCGGTFVRVVGINGDIRCSCGTPLDGWFPSRFIKLDGLTEQETTQEEITA